MEFNTGSGSVTVLLNLSFAEEPIPFGRLFALSKPPSLLVSIVLGLSGLNGIWIRRIRRLPL